MSDFWIKPRDEYYVQTGSMFENPYGVPHDEIQRFIDNNPPEVVAQVVYGKYVEGSGLVFTAEVINELFDRSIGKVLDEQWIDKERWAQGRIEQARRFSPNRYHTGVDLARKNDHTVIFTLDTVHHPARVVYFRRTNRVPWPTIYAEIGRAALHLFPGRHLLDATAIGDVIIEELEHRYYCPKHHLAFEITGPCPKSGDGCDPKSWKRYSPEGYTFSAGSKVSLVNHLQSCLGHGYDQADPEKAFGRLRCPPIHQLEEELAVYAWDDKKLDTDCVFGLALAAWSGLEDRPPPPSSSPVYGVTR